LFAVGLQTCTAVARSLCVSWAFLLLLQYHNYMNDIVYNGILHKLKPYCASSRLHAGTVVQYTIVS